MEIRGVVIRTLDIVNGKNPSSTTAKMNRLQVRSFNVVTFLPAA